MASHLYLPPCGLDGNITFFKTSSHSVQRRYYSVLGPPLVDQFVYEYSLRGRTIMMDCHDGYILWTSIWRALGHYSVDLRRLIAAHPPLSSQRRVLRGGGKNRGTWVSYHVAYTLALRVASSIAHDLVPFFGPEFPASCVAKNHPDFGKLGGVQLTTIYQDEAQVPDSSWQCTEMVLSTNNPDQYLRWNEGLPSSQSFYLPQSPPLTTVQFSAQQSLSTQKVRMESELAAPNSILLPELNLEFPNTSHFTLPPISTLFSIKNISEQDSKAALKRLQSEESDYRHPNWQLSD